MAVNMSQRISSDTVSQSTAWRWMFGLTIAAIVTRVVHLNSGLWLDEYYSIVEQFRYTPLQVFTTYIGDNQHPLYALLASISLSLFGEDAWTARLPAALFGIASIPALYIFAAQVTRRKEAILAAALLAFSYHHVWFSQNARGYTAIALAAILCSFYLMRLFNNGTKRDALMYGVIAALGAYAHLTMVFVVVGHFLVYVLIQLVSLIKNKRLANWSLPLLAFVAAGGLTLVLYGPILSQVIDFFVNKPSLGNLSSPSWALQEAIRSLSLGFGASIIVLSGLLMVVVGFVSYLRSMPVALGVFVLPIVVTLFVATMARGTMYPRFFFAVIGMAILIGVRGVMVTVNWCVKLVYHGKNREVLAERMATAAMIFTILVSAASLLRNYQHPKMDFAAAQQWLETTASKKDVIVTAGSAAWPFREYYKLPWPEMITAEDLATQDNLATSQGGNVLVVYAFARYMEVSAPDVLQSIRDRCTNKKRFVGTLGGGDLFVCRLRSI